MTIILWNEMIDFIENVAAVTEHKRNIPILLNLSVEGTNCK